ncbi:MAG: sigma 54-dependent Fis family transcriptional regulator [Deltaproteobacteria bacterium]|nr:sigma 54-dependent Fis family transcriptional regulator [Deltaproteobacteria bacterium]
MAPTPPDHPNVTGPLTVDDEIKPAPLEVRELHLACTSGPDSGRSWRCGTDRCSIGSHRTNEVVLSDRTVSRFHCEILVVPAGARIHDLASRNGTLVDGVQVFDGMLKDGATIRLGATTLRFELSGERQPVPVSQRASFGTLVGVSVPIRTTFALLVRAAATDATVLLEGETGTGKEGAAESIHEASERRGRPFVVVDCSAIPPNLLESELFGHEKGAFTGATASRVGAFEAADTGTVFLDEIGELPPDLQPKLLRVLGQREVQRVGSGTPKNVDVRLIAATNRDLRTEVNEKRFRPDLYFRLAVLKIRLPPLRERPEDIPALVRAFLDRLGADTAASAALLEPSFIAHLQRASWPGNVRELFNHLERCLVLQEDLPLPEGGPPTTAAVDARISYAEARHRAQMDFERRYLHALLELHHGNVSGAARAAGIARPYLHRLLRKHGVTGFARGD